LKGTKQRSRIEPSRVETVGTRHNRRKEMTNRELLLMEECKRHAVTLTKKAFALAAAKLGYLLDSAHIEADRDEATALHTACLERFAQLDEEQAEVELRRLDADERFQAAEAVHARFRN